MISEPHNAEWLKKKKKKDAYGNEEGVGVKNVVVIKDLWSPRGRGREQDGWGAWG